MLIRLAACASATVSPFGLRRMCLSKPAARTREAKWGQPTIFGPGMEAARRRRRWVAGLPNLWVATDSESLRLSQPLSRNLERGDEVGGLVICAVDDSRGARDAARVAYELARRLDERMLVVHVTQVPVVAGASGVPHGREDLRDLAREDAEEVLARVTEDSGCLDAERQVAFGEPAQALIKLADSEEATMIIVGSRGRSALRAALLGSVSLRLCRAAPCPVLVVPPGATLALQRPADAARATG